MATSAPNLLGTCTTKKLGLLLSAALVASMPSIASAAGVCDQQGHRVKINGVYHKVVRVSGPRGSHLVDCGLGL